MRSLALPPKGRGDPVVQRLLNVLQRVLSEQEYINRKIPLSWLRTLDMLFTDVERSNLTFVEVQAIMRECGVRAEHMELLLRFLHSMGKVIWFEEPALRDVVITDPIEYLAKPASTVICKLKQEGNDVTLHSLPVHKKAQKMMQGRWMKLRDEGEGGDNNLEPT